MELPPSGDPAIAPSTTHGDAGHLSRLAPKRSGIGGSGALPWQVRQEPGPLPPLAEVTALRGRYGQRGPVGRAEERFLVWAAELDRMLAALPAEQLVDQVMAKDLRRPLFMLEGLLRLYRHRHGKAFTKRLEAVKRFEDQIGEVDYYRGVLAELGRAAVPKKVMRYFEAELEHAEKKLGKLVRQDWLSTDGRSPGIGSLLHALGKATWGSYGEDREALRQELGDQLKKVAGLELDMHEPEAGLHELRRQIRWFPIYFTALGGVAELVDDRHPIPEYAHWLNEPQAGSKFARLPASDREVGPWPMSRSLYVANTAFIDELGKIKDTFLVHEALGEALVETGVVRSRKAAAAAARGYLGHTEAELAALQERADTIAAELHDKGLMRHWRRALRDA